MYKDKDGEVIVGMDNQWLAEQGAHPMSEGKPLPVLMILCYASRQEPHINVSWEISSSMGWK